MSALTCSLHLERIDIFLTGISFVISVSIIQDKIFFRKNRTIEIIQSYNYVVTSLRTDFSGDTN
jgi:hypothetical protein